MKTTAKPMTKWLLSLVFALVVISLLLVPQVLKQEASATQYSRDSISEGSSTIHISTANQLAQLLYRYFNDGATWAGKTIVLDNDINMRPNGTTLAPLSNTTTTKGKVTTSGTYTTPATDSNNPRFDKTQGTNYMFKGTFDGQGHTISGLVYYKNAAGGANCQGLLFDKCAGTVKNVRFKDCLFEWDQPKHDGNSALGLIGGLDYDGDLHGLVENVILESTVYFITRATGSTSSGTNRARVGGIAGWCDGGTVRNCTSFATIVSVSYGSASGTTFTTSSRNSYPAVNNGNSGVPRVLYGAIVGSAQSNCTITNCVGYGTFYVHASTADRTLNQVNDNGNNYGWNQVSPSYQNSNQTMRGNVEGVTGTSDWYYRSWNTSASWPSWYNFSGTYTLSNATQVAEFFNLIDKGVHFFGDTIKLGANVNLNAGWNGQLTVSGTTASIPSAPSTTFNTSDKISSDSSWARAFGGTFDGQGYCIKGFYSSLTANQNCQGMFGNVVGDNKNIKPVIKNLIVQNSYIERKHGSAAQIGGLAGTVRGSVTIQNCYIDIDLCVRNGAYDAYIGGVCNYGGTGGGNMTFSNIVYAGTMVQVDGTSSTTVSTRTSGRLGMLYQNAGSVPGSATDLLNSTTYYAGITDRTIGGANNVLTVTSGNGSFTNGSTGYKQTSSVSGWTYNGAFCSYLPGSVASLAGFATAGISSYTLTSNRPDAVEGSTFTIGSWSNFTTLISTINNDNTAGRNFRFKLTADIEAYPKASYAAWADFYSESTWASGASISVPGWPEQNNFVRFTNFQGVLDGDGHVMSRLFSRRTAYNQSKEGGLFYAFNGTIKNLAIIDSFFAGDHSGYGNASGVQYGGLAGSGSGTIENCYFDYDCFMINNYACNSSGGFCGYGYLFGGLSGVLNLKNVQCAGRFWVCNASMQNTIETTSGSACGVIAGNGGYTVNIENFVFSGQRSTYIAGSGGTNDVAYLVHWSNSCNFSGNNFYGKSNGSAGNTTGVGPTADGTNYKLIPRFGEVGPAALATTFGSGTYKLSTWAQKGSASGRIRLVAKISRSAAKSATEVGFRLTRSGDNKKATVPVTGVYKSVTANNSTFTAGSLAGRGDYLIAIAITGAQTGLTLTIEPYIKIGSTYYYGSSTSYTIS